MTDSEPRMRRCAACDGDQVYLRSTGANGGYGPRLLEGLGRFLKPAKMDVYVCAECGHMAFYADAETRRRVRETIRWRKVK